MVSDNNFKGGIMCIVDKDVERLLEARKSYGESWCKRGGIGAFMMLARKWDRIENQTQKCGWDVFKATESFPGKEGLLDDIRDLRAYLILVEEYIGRVEGGKCHGSETT